MRQLVLPVALAILMAGNAACGNSEAGTPNPISSHPPSSTGASAPTATRSLPPRPRSLPLDGVDPCGLLTEQQLASFSIDRPPRGGTGVSGPLRGAPGCNFDTSVEAANDWGFLIILSTTVGLSEYLEQVKDNPTRRVVTISGFPAIQDEQRSDIAPGNDTCFVDVDVADGQMLEMQFGQIAADEGKVLPMETLCAKAVEVAEAALTTLQGQR